MKKFTSKDPRKVTKAFEKTLNRDIEFLNNILKFKILYGIPKGQNKDGENIDEYARMVHDGSFSSNIPARQFLKTIRPRYGYRIKEELAFTLAFIKKKYATNNQLPKSEIKSILEKNIALMLINFVKDNILNGNWTPNAPATIKKKKSSRPLVDKGEMLSSVNSLVVEK